jgi:hypothetical protein
MELFEKRKERKFAKLSSETGPSGGETEANRKTRERQYRRANIREDIRKAIPGGILTFFGVILSYYLIASSIGQVLSIVFVSGSFIFLYFWEGTKISKTYIPPSEHYLLLGHSDPGNIKSPYKIERWIIPKNLVKKYVSEGEGSIIYTINGAYFLCDRIDFDSTTGDLSIHFDWIGLSEFNFVTDHNVYHKMKGIIPILQEIIDDQDAMREVIINSKVKKGIREKAKRMFDTILSPEDIDPEDYNRDIEREYLAKVDKARGLLRPEPQGEQGKLPDKPHEGGENEQ